MEMMKTLLLVILYDKEIDKSLTLECISQGDFKNCDLVIVNNGPQKIVLEGSFHSLLMDVVSKIELREYLDNRPLSWIYNEIIVDYIHYERIIFLDDDSHLNSNFLSNIDRFYCDDIDIQIPKILERSDHQLYYPLVNGFIYDGHDGEIIDAEKDVLSIGSGLVIYRSLIDKFSHLNLEVFDSRFALYGVDFSLFRRVREMRKNNIYVKIQLVSYVNHSLSRASDNISEWRYKERLYDSVLSIRFYSKNTFHSFLRLTKYLGGELLKGNVRSVPLIFKTYFIGKHPRCR
ncbi:glycosyltransferase family 2 protein [Sodalis sp. RH16]|uniref:glycosyltransferase family 2 protein n=1 Tax=Sodalis sp. RH16 TaxID=3394331 RepID=UPI0039B4CCDC